MESNYTVQVEEFANSHFIKNFEKKYKSHWAPSLDAVLTQLQFIDNLLNTDKADLVVSCDVLKIVKTQFRVFNTKESAKTSGNRCIIAVHEDLKLVKVLLMYTKTDIAQKNETAAWKRLIKENYPEYESILLMI
jgi:hypothetical protein